MEYRTNSGPGTPVSVRPETLERALHDHYIMHRALVRWDGPRHPALNTYGARLRCFDKSWQHDKPTAEVLSAAWFYIGTDLVITSFQNGTHSTLHTYKYILNSYRSE